MNEPRADDTGGAELREHLHRVNEALGAVRDAVPPTAVGDVPILFVFGVPRSGTSLLAQVLGHGLVLSWPDNIVARFWAAPWIGLAASMSVRAQYEVHFGPVERPFESRHGVTRGLFDPHEFGYFWSHWFGGFEPVHWRSPEQLRAVDTAGLAEAVGRMHHVARPRPLLFRVTPLGMNLTFLAAQFPAARFVWIERAPMDVARSIYRARQAVNDDVTRWWSLRPPEYDRLARLPAADQIAGQIQCCHYHIEQAFEQVAGERRIKVAYDNLLADPRGVAMRAGRLVDATPALDRLPESFPTRATSPQPADVESRLREALNVDHVQR